MVDITEHINLVYFVVKKYFHRKKCDRDYEDLVAMGNIGLVVAYNLFDEKRGIRFSTFATRCIFNGIMKGLRHEDKDKNKASLDAERYDDLDMYNVLKCDEENYTQIENKIYLYEMLKKINMTNTEKKVVQYAISSDTTFQREIAKKVGVSQVQVGRIFRNIRKKMLAYA